MKALYSKVTGHAALSLALSWTGEPPVPPVARAARPTRMYSSCSVVLHFQGLRIIHSRVLVFKVDPEFALPPTMVHVHQRKGKRVSKWVIPARKTVMGALS